MIDDNLILLEICFALMICSQVPAPRNNTIAYRDALRIELFDESQSHISRRRHMFRKEDDNDCILKRKDDSPYALYGLIGTVVGCLCLMEKNILLIQWVEKYLKMTL